MKGCERLEHFVRQRAPKQIAFTERIEVIGVRPLDSRKALVFQSAPYRSFEPCCRVRCVRRAIGGRWRNPFEKSQTAEQQKGQRPLPEWTHVFN